jgi:hypothetical protein
MAFVRLYLAALIAIENLNLCLQRIGALIWIKERGLRRYPE